MITSFVAVFLKVILRNGPLQGKNGPLERRMDLGAERMSSCKEEWTLA